ncbi:hypothetical protein PROFUN_03407 [Planoprotostelium fungivorum]|uniref:Rab-GAP TBC domain-containing protein n=1 Tax=Planoprotostelium fungivorum TaxID=1890364 RepID=A0A2P6NWN9_9EUKA|nr:hypothetical protein PROFUN_03407 [Planoprotostelium fungivorum]
MSPVALSGSNRKEELDWFRTDSEFLEEQCPLQSTHFLYLCHYQRAKRKILPNKSGQFSLCISSNSNIMADFFARVRSQLQRTEEKKKAQAQLSPDVKDQEGDPVRDAGDKHTATSELPKEKKKSLKSKLTSGLSKKDKKGSGDKDSTRKKSSRTSSKKSATKKTASVLPPTEMYVDSLTSLRAGVISVRGQIWLSRLKASRQQMDDRSSVSYNTLVQLPIPEEHREQIGKDIDRTYPQYDLFQQVDVQKKMSQVLHAIAAFRPDLGYCQGMCYVVGFLNTFMPVEDTFWFMIQLIDHFGMADFWSSNLAGLPRAFYILEKLIETEIPKLWKHFNDMDMQTSMYATPWLMTLFLYNHSIPFSTRLWDILLFQGGTRSDYNQPRLIEIGFNYVYAIALSILSMHEEQMLKMDFDQCAHFLQFSCRKLGSEPDVEQVLRISSRMNECIEPVIGSLNKEYTAQLLSNLYLTDVAAECEIELFVGFTTYIVLYTDTLFDWGSPCPSWSGYQSDHLSLAFLAEGYHSMSLSMFLVANDFQGSRSSQNGLLLSETIEQTRSLKITFEYDTTRWDSDNDYASIA